MDVCDEVTRDALAAAKHLKRASEAAQAIAAAVHLEGNGGQDAIYCPWHLGASACARLRRLRSH